MSVSERVPAQRQDQFEWCWALRWHPLADARGSVVSQQSCQENKKLYDCNAGSIPRRERRVYWPFGETR